MVKTSLNRYTENYILWFGTLKKLCEESHDNNLIPFVKNSLFKVKEHLPTSAKLESGLSKYDTYQDIFNIDDLEFAKICLYFADASIYETSVYEDNNTFIYYAKVDNTTLLYPILFADFLVNTTTFLNTMDTEFKIDIGLNNPMNTEKNPFTYLMETAFKNFYPNVEVNIHNIEG